MSKPKNYLEQRREMKLKGKKPASVERHEKIVKGQFFADAIKAAPDRCQNCNNTLNGTKAINPAAIVAHIIPKSKTNGCPSVAAHPLNKVYLCGDCHTNMDNQGCDFITEMKIYDLMKRRVVLMWGEIPANERRRVPECLKPKNE
jgi:5-methylcytosine-specific restriction endonuclease McrA